MQTLEHATALLHAADSSHGKTEILRFLGFSERALPLDLRSRKALALPEAVHAAHIAQGPGALRGLAVDLGHGAELRQVLASVANALATHSAQLLWIVVATHASTAELAIVCWSARQSRTRIRSLMCDRARLFESDAETLCALSSAASDSDLLTHSRWLDILGREAITRRFFRNVQASVGDLAGSLDPRIGQAERSELALLYISRLIFLSFLET
ncbi:MAG: hypothetical protein ABI408_05830, partial [Gemmatimonadaceae bacterium]